MPRSRPQRSSCKSRSRTRLDLDRDCFHALPCRRDPASVVAGRDSNPRPSGYEPAEVNRIPARSHCPFLVLTPGISAQFLEADLDMSRANTGRFAGVFGMTCEREQLLAMQKVVGSSPISRFPESRTTTGLLALRRDRIETGGRHFSAGCPFGAQIRLDQRHARSCAGSGSATSDGYVPAVVGSGDAEWLGSLPPARVVPHAVEAGPEHVHGCADDLLAGHVWVLVPPEREPGETGANDFRGHLECFLVGGAREVLRARLAGEDDAERHPRLGLDLAVRRLGAGIAGRLAEEHPRGLAVLLDVACPRVECARHPDLRTLVAEQVLAPRLQQLVARTLEQTPVQVDLRREVVVQDRRRHATRLAISSIDAPR